MCEYNLENNKQQAKKKIKIKYSNFKCNNQLYGIKNLVFNNKINV